MDEVAVHHQPAAEPVAAGLLVEGDEPAFCERCEKARHRARVQPGAPGDLVRAQLGCLEEGVEHGHRARDRSDRALGWFSRSGHATFRIVSLTHYCRGGNSQWPRSRSLLPMSSSAPESTV